MVAEGMERAVVVMDGDQAAAEMEMAVADGADLSVAGRTAAMAEEACVDSAE